MMEISEVPVYKILDTFIVDNESPVIIINFLKDHESEFNDIIKNSICINRIFQIDFFLKCGFAETDYLLSKLKDIPIASAAIFTWQILRSKSNKAQRVQYSFRKELNWILKHGPAHPYAFGHERYVSLVDNLLFNVSSETHIADIFSKLNRSTLCEFFKNFNYSLFRDRILQEDVFDSLDDVAKYVILNEIKKYCKDTWEIKNTFYIKSFLLQLLEYSNDVEVKKVALDIFKESHGNLFTLNRELLSLIHSCSSFHEFKLRSTITGITTTPMLLIYLACNKKSWFKDWVEYNKNEIDDCLKISDIFCKKK